MISEAAVQKSPPLECQGPAIVKEEILQSSEAPQQISEAPQQISEALQQTSETPQQISEALQQTSETPQQISDALQQTSEAPQQIGKAPQQTSKTPQQISKASQRSSKALEQNSKTPQQKGGASPALQVVKRRWAFKIIVLGDSGIGKTWLIETALTSPEADSTAELKEHLSRHHLHHYQQQKQQEELQQLQKLRRGDGDTKDEPPGTIGVTFNLTKLELDGSTVLLQVWDTSGKDRYRGLLANYMTDLNCIIIAYNPCRDSAETCCQSLARWHQFAQESSVQASGVAASKAQAPTAFFVVAIGGGIGDGNSGCPNPQACDHVRCLAVGRAFAETLRGRFFQCRRWAGGDGAAARCEWIGGQELTAQWLGRELLRRHFNSLARLLEEEGEDATGGAMKDQLSSCCQRLAKGLRELVHWPALAVFLLSRRLLPRD